MPNVTINAVPFTGDIFSNPLAVRRAPIEAKIIAIPITNILVGRNGTRNKMDYGTKHRFELDGGVKGEVAFSGSWAGGRIAVRRP